ncbi:hypothetical protein LTR85_000154 [Meristemomyces frigidus]|nr:hypothetical protein LTR85_000154 [Meristemomyces frigidus]
MDSMTKGLLKNNTQPVAERVPSAPPDAAEGLPPPKRRKIVTLKASKLKADDSNISQARVSVDAFGATITALAKQNAELENENTRLTSTVAQLQDGLDTAIRRQTQLQRACDFHRRKEEKMAVLWNEHNQLVSREQKLAWEFANLKEERSSENARLASQSSEIATLKNQKKEQDAKLASQDALLAAA